MHKGLGVDEISVHQAGVKHPSEERKVQWVTIGPSRWSTLRQCDLLPAVIRLYRFFQAAKERAILGIGIALVAAVRQA